MTIRSVSLLLGHRTIPTWFVEAVELMLAETSVSISHVAVRADTDPLTERRGLINAARWMIRGDYHYKPVFRDPEPLVQLSEVGSLDEIDETVYTPVGDGTRTELPKSLVATLADDSDVVVQWGSGILTGDILTKPQYGVWNIHHGDTRKYRGSAPGFWEFLDGANQTGVTLIQLDESVDGGAVVERRTVEIGDAHSWPEIQRRLYGASIPLLAAGVERVNSNGGPRQPAVLGDLYTAADVTLPVRARYLLKASTEFIRRLM